MEMIMTATEFRAKCLGLIDWVARTGGTIVITKRGRPVARLVPIPANVESDESIEVDTLGRSTRQLRRYAIPSSPR
jgi:prevent-host-death family protein